MNTFKKISIVVVVLAVSLGSMVYAQPAGTPSGSTGSAVLSGTPSGSTTNAPSGTSAGSTTGIPAGTQSGGTTGRPTGTPSGTTGATNFYIQNPLSSRFSSVGGIVQGGLEIFSYVVILFAVLMIIYVGLQFVLAQGNPKRLSELKGWLLWIVIGVAVVIGARIIVSVVINTLEATNTVSPGVIQNARNALTP